MFLKYRWYGLDSLKEIHMLSKAQKRFRSKLVVGILEKLRMMIFKPVIDASPWTSY